MTNFALTTPNGWSELPAGRWFIAGDTQYLYADMLDMTPQKRTSLGIKPIEETPIPEDKVSTGSSIVDRDDKPVRVWDLEDALKPVITPESVNDEASRRIAAGFTFKGKLYDYDDKAQKRITGAATLAGFAARAGAPEGYLLWHGGEEPFAWIAMDNSLTQMDAPTCFAFGQAAAAWESAHVFAGRALKDRPGGIPADYADDAHWPPAG